MKSRPIKLIEIDEKDNLRVYAGNDYREIYRAAAGIEFNEKIEALIAREPHKWEKPKLFCQIICVVLSEYERN